MFDIDTLLAPLAGGDPCGPDLSFSQEFDAIAHARTFDEPGLDQGVWTTRCKEADWGLVVRQCGELLARRSKDLRLAVWLAEGAARCGDLGGFADACGVLAGLCDRYWERLHPQADQDQEQRIGTLLWFAQRSAHWLAGIPITAGSPHGCTLVEIECALHAQDGDGGPGAAAVEQARRAGDRAFYTALLAQLTSADAALERLGEVMDGILGMDAPSLADSLAVLRRMADLVRADAEAAGVGAAQPQTGQAPPAPAAPAQASGQAIGSRAQALACLKQVAAYFRQHEPHSPVSYLADKAAAWGELPLHLWLRAVVKDPAVLGQLDDVLGAAEPGA